ncbi:MAG: hypothetical protein ACC608_00345 [Anaerofustis sp.]
MDEQGKILNEILGVLRDMRGDLSSMWNREEDCGTLCDKLDAITATLNVLSGGGMDNIGAVIGRLDAIESTLSELSGKLDEMHLSIESINSTVSPLE